MAQRRRAQLALFDDGERRFALGPLQAAIEARYGSGVRSAGYGAAKAAGIDSQTWLRWRKAGLSVEAADRVAVRKLGVHPCVIWADWFDDIEETG